MNPIFLIFLFVVVSILVIFSLSYYQYLKTNKEMSALKTKFKAHKLQSDYLMVKNEMLEDELKLIKSIYRNKLMKANQLEKEIA